MTATAKMPASCWGSYRRVAVIELTPDAAAAGLLPGLISDRPKTVCRIVRTWEKLHVGSTDRCAYSRALVEAEALATSLNS